MVPMLLVILTLAVLYWFPIRRWMSRWGTTPSDLSRVMAGDSLLDPTYSGTMAVIVNAPPEHIWPWLVQIGYQRGGLYSYDWLDRLFGYLDRPSATRILPEFQHLAVGDEIPLGRGPSWPVAAIEPCRALVLDMRNMGGFDWVWQFGLYPVDEKRTRLVSRSRVRTHDRLGLAAYVCDRACGISHDAAHVARSQAAGRSAAKPSRRHARPRSRGISHGKRRHARCAEMDSGRHWASSPALTRPTWARRGFDTVNRLAAGADDVDPVLDRCMPVYDVAERHHISVAAPAAITFAAACEQNLMARRS